MKARALRDRGQTNTGLLIITAKEESKADIERMMKVVKRLEDSFGYEQIVKEEENVIIMSTAGDSCKEVMESYKIAKTAAL